MKKLLIPFIIGIVLGLGGTTAAVAFLGGGSESLTGSLAEATAEGDTLTAEAEHGEVTDSAGHAEADAHDVEALPDSAAHLASVEGGDMYVGAPAGSPDGAISAAGVEIETESAPRMEPARLAKVFASMQAREAASVLEHLDDDEIQVILAQLGNREAAAILSNIPPERAALISRAVIRGERSTQ